MQKTSAFLVKLAKKLERRAEYHVGLKIARHEDAEAGDCLREVATQCRALSVEIGTPKQLEIPEISST